MELLLRRAKKKPIILYAVKGNNPIFIELYLDARTYIDGDTLLQVVGSYRVDNEVRRERLSFLFKGWNVKANSLNTSAFIFESYWLAYAYKLQLEHDQQTSRQKVP